MNKFFVFLAVVACAAMPAMADTYTSVWYNTSITGRIGGASQSGYTNVYITPELLRTGTSSEDYRYFKVFCIDIMQASQSTMNLDSTTDMMSAPKGTTNLFLETWQLDRLGRLFGQYWDDLGWGATGTSPDVLTPTNLDGVAAFQLAVWEIVNQRDQDVRTSSANYDVKAGWGLTDPINNNIKTGFQTTLNNRTVTDQANAWLQTLDNGQGPTGNLVALTSSSVQDFTYLVGFKGPIPTVVPAPGAALLGVIGLGLAGSLKRRFGA